MICFCCWQKYNYVCLHKILQNGKREEGGVRWNGGYYRTGALFLHLSFLFCYNMLQIGFTSFVLHVMFLQNQNDTFKHLEVMIVTPCKIIQIPKCSHFSNEWTIPPTVNKYANKMNHNIKRFCVVVHFVAGAVVATSSYPPIGVLWSIYVKWLNLILLGFVSRRHTLDVPQWHRCSQVVRGIEDRSLQVIN